MGKISICFPIVWNGLIEGRTEMGQYHSFMTIFHVKYTDDNQDKRSDISSFINARQGRKLSWEFLMEITKLEKTGDVQVLVERIEKIKIRSIRDVVSAFHNYLSNNLSVDPDDQEKLVEALLQDNPELYIARALFAGVRYTGSVKMLNKEYLNKLTTLVEDTDFPDAFAEAQKAAKKEKIKEKRTKTNPDSRKASTINRRIKSKYLQKVLGEMKQYIDKIPDPLPPDVKEILTGLSETELHMFLDTKDRILCRSMGMFREYFFLASNEMLNEYKHPGLFVSSHYIELLQDYNMLESFSGSLVIYAPPTGVEPFEDSNRDLSLWIYPKHEDECIEIELPVFRFTPAGIIVASFLGLLTSDAYIREMAEVLQEKIGDKCQVVIVQRELEYRPFVETMKEDKEREKDT